MCNIRRLHNPSVILGKASYDTSPYAGEALGTAADIDPYDVSKAVRRFLRTVEDACPYTVQIFPLCYRLSCRSKRVAEDVDPYDVSRLTARPPVPTMYMRPPVLIIFPPSFTTKQKERKRHVCFIYK